MAVVVFAVAGVAVPHVAAAQTAAPPQSPLQPAPDSSAPQPTSPTPTLRVSDEGTRTYFAYVKRGSMVRAKPARRANRVGQVRRFTYYGFRDLALVLREKLVGGRKWSLVRYAGLGIRKGWVASSALGRPRLVTTLLVIDRPRLRVSLYKRGKLIFSTRAGVGARRSPTPGGRFFIRERVVPVNKNTVYGVLAFGLSGYSRFRTDWPGGGQIGIHGTNQPGLLPGYISNGCIRVRNGAIRRLNRLMPIGTPVLIR